MDTWEDFSNFMENTAFEDYDEIIIDTIPPKQIEHLITKEEALKFFATAAAVAIEKDYMCDEIDDFAYRHYDDCEGDGDYDELWDDIKLYFREIFGCEYTDCY